MKTNAAPTATLNDMVFENRNKAYGAYVLRSLYDRHLRQALVCSLAFFLVLFSVPTVADLFQDKAVPLPPVAPPKLEKWTEVVLPEDKPEVMVEEPAAAQPKAATVKNNTIKVVSDNTPVIDEIPSQDQLKTANSGSVTSEGDGTANLNQLEAGEGTGSAAGTGTAAAPVDPTIFLSVENMPQFEGGLSRLMEFVSKNIKYPRAAQANGVEGTVVVSFVVGASGEVTDIQILKGLGYGTEEEAIRVMKKLPRWTPGNQNGRNVPVRMTLPIRLELK
jgi:protein TonB